MDYKKGWDELKSELDRQKIKAEKEYKIRKNQFHEARKIKENEEEQKKLYGYIHQKGALKMTLVQLKLLKIVKKLKKKTMILN